MHACVCVNVRICVRGDLLGRDVCAYIYVCMGAGMYIDIKCFSSLPTPQCVSPSCSLPLPTLLSLTPPSPLPPGLLGVSPFPSNCSSVDNNTNTCTVTATINSSLTLCVDFVKYPELAKRHAELDQTTWKQVLPGEENILSCFGSQCASPAVGYSYTGDWGRCLHKESVGNNTLISYSIEEVFPPKNYPPNLVHRTVLFNIQG